MSQVTITYLEGKERQDFNKNNQKQIRYQLRKEGRQALKFLKSLRSVKASNLIK